MPGPARPFLPGNPGPGRPKKLQDLIREMEAKGDVLRAREVLREIMDGTVNGMPCDPKDTLTAALAVLGYVYGKPRQQLSVEASVQHLAPHLAIAEGWTARARDLPPAQQRALLEAMRAAAKALAGGGGDEGEGGAGPASAPAPGFAPPALPPGEDVPTLEYTPGGKPRK